MARYPIKTPTWAIKPYGDEGAWELAKRECRTVLLEWAAAEYAGTYTELSKRVTAIDWPEGAYTHHGQQMGMLLGQVSMEELVRTEDRPVLSSLVIGQDEGMPSAGYWKFMDEELGIAVPTGDVARLEFWVRQFKDACAFYGSPPSRPG